MDPRLAPRDYDIALLYTYAYAQLVPKTAAHIHRQFAPLLDSTSGRAALLAVCAELLQSASRGDHPYLTPKLRALADESAAA